MELVVVVGTIPIKSDSSDEIPASSSLVTPAVQLLLRPPDVVDFNLDVDDDDGSRFRRFAATPAACIPPPSSLLKSEESLENPPLPAAALVRFCTEVVVLLVVERANGRTAFSRK